MRLLAAIGFLAIVLAIGASVYFLGGYYDVAASSDDIKPVEWTLIRVREASMDKRSIDKPPIKLDDPAVIRDGAKAYSMHGCVNCHGGPGADWAKFSEGLNPGPPDLKDVAKEDTPSHLFWAIKHGIRMTGMPSFAKAGVADDEIWKIVAFVKKLPDVSEADYKSWTSSAPASRQ
jgi:mono/diheme cytochrome c family protein